VNNQEAKFILSAYRPGGEDACTTHFAAALEQVSRDPVLAAWFSNQRALDMAISDALYSISVPDDLRTNILAGAKISRRRLWPHRPVFFAMAATLMLLACVAGFWMHQSALDPWQKDALAFIPNFANGQSHFDHEAIDGLALQQWLQAQHAPAADVMPAALEALPALGCKTISSNGKLVSITCFRMPGGELVHLIVTDASGLKHPLPQQPRFVRQNGWITASWTQNGHALMLATKASDRELRDLLTTSIQAGT
jgi:hypothetical protein